MLCSSHEAPAQDVYRMCTFRCLPSADWMLCVCVCVFDVAMTGTPTLYHCASLSPMMCSLCSCWGRGVLPGSVYVCIIPPHNRLVHMNCTVCLRAPCMTLGQSLLCVHQVGVCVCFYPLCMSMFCMCSCTIGLFARIGRVRPWLYIIRMGCWHVCD